jgi:hypothetical protein
MGIPAHKKCGMGIPAHEHGLEARDTQIMGKDAHATPALWRFVGASFMPLSPGPFPFRGGLPAGFGIFSSFHQPHGYLLGGSAQRQWRRLAGQIVGALENLLL